MSIIRKDLTVKLGVDFTRLQQFLRNISPILPGIHRNIPEYPTDFAFIPKFRAEKLRRISGKLRETPRNFGETPRNSRKLWRNSEKLRETPENLGTLFFRDYPGWQVAVAGNSTLLRVSEIAGIFSIKKE